MRTMGGRHLRRSVLALLLEAFPESVSGERMACRLQVSRVAVWKVIQSLREEGFPVAASRGGYRLLELPDVFDPDFLEPYLGSAVSGIRVVYENEVDSTNTRLKTLAEEGAPEGTLYIAERQTKGRGRRGRSWFSLPGKSLTFSVLLRPSLPPAACPSITLLAGLSLAQALEDLGFCPELKWPNDVLLGGKKVAGILLEASTDLDMVAFLVLGVGVNVSLERDDLAGLPFQATSLSVEGGQPLPRVAVLRQFLARFFTAYRKWETTGDFTPWIPEYHRRSPFLGHPVTIFLGEDQVSGIARRVDGSGALWIAKGSEEQRIHWGEIG